MQAASCPFLLNAMSMPPLPKHGLASSPDIPKDAFNTNPTTGSGPFVFKERQKGDHITLTANTNYWRGKPKFDQWIFKVVPDANVLAVQLNTGEVDMAIVQADALQDLQGSVDIKSYFGRSYDFLAYNTKRPIFADARVRQALTYALDRNQIVQEVLFGQGQVIQSPIPVLSWALASRLPTYDTNQDSAPQLLADAGWVSGPDGVLRKDGQPFQFTLETNAGTKVRAADTVIAQAHRIADLEDGRVRCRTGTCTFGSDAPSVGQHPFGEIDASDSMAQLRQQQRQKAGAGTNIEDVGRRWWQQWSQPIHPDTTLRVIADVVVRRALRSQLGRLLVPVLIDFGLQIGRLLRHEAAFVAVSTRQTISLFSNPLTKFSIGSRRITRASRKPAACATGSAGSSVG
jgi:hypothetical protein